MKVTVLWWDRPVFRDELHNPEKLYFDAVVHCWRSKAVGDKSGPGDTRPYLLLRDKQTHLWWVSPKDTPESSREKDIGPFDTQEEAKAAAETLNLLEP